jgi:hypothetical protein
MPIVRRKNKSLLNKAKRQLGLTPRERMNIRNVILPLLFVTAALSLIEEEEEEEEEEDGVEEVGDNPYEEMFTLMTARFLGSAYVNVPVNLSLLARFKNDNFDDPRDRDCFLYLKFTKPQSYHLLNVLDIPERIRLPNRSVVGRELVLLCSLHRFGQGSGHFLKASLLFGVEESKLVRTFHYFISYMIQHFAHLLTDNLEYWLPSFRHFADCIRTKFVAHTGLHQVANLVMLFIDGNDTRSSRPGGGPMESGVNAPRYNQNLQRAFFNMYRHFHGIKQLTITAPNGMTIWYFGVMSRRRNDNFLVAESGIDDKLRALQEDELFVL